MDRFKLRERVVRLPRCGFADMLSWSVNADAGVLLYRNNDLGNFFTAPGRLTEYLACGLPVIGTNHTGLENLILRYDLGVAVDSAKPRRIADGLLELEAATRQGRYCANRGKFLERFAFDLWEPAIVEAFNALLEPRRRDSTSRPAFPWLPNP
jgi:glycosyltransferase involved in cell wall biosynthesis